MNKTPNLVVRAAITERGREYWEVAPDDWRQDPVSAHATEAEARAALAAIKDKP